MQFLIISCWFTICLQCIVKISSENRNVEWTTEGLTIFLEGDVAVFVCPMPQNQTPFTWEKGQLKYYNYKHVNPSLSDKIKRRLRLISKQKASHLEVANLTTDDSGTYRCTYIAETKLHQAVFNITVISRPAVDVIDLENTIHCSVICKSNKCGYKFNVKKFSIEERTIYDEYVRRIEYVPEVDITLWNVTKHKSKNERVVTFLLCKTVIKIQGLKDDITAVGKSTAINLGFRKPECSSIDINDLETDVVIEGYRSSISVYFFSNPMFLEVQWILNDTKIDTEKSRYRTSIKEFNISTDVYNTTILVDGYKGTLTIDQFSHRDLGVYSANITNENGQSACTGILLLLKDMPEISTGYVFHANILKWYVILCGCAVVVLIAMNVTYSRYRTETTK